MYVYILICRDLIQKVYSNEDVAWAEYSARQKNNAYTETYKSCLRIEKQFCEMPENQQG